MDVNNISNTSATVIVFPKAINGFVQFQPIKDIQMINDSIDFSVLVYIEQKVMMPEEFDLVILKRDSDDKNDCSIYVLEHISIGKSQKEKGILNQIIENNSSLGIDNCQVSFRRTFTYSYENAKMLGSGSYFIALVSAERTYGVNVISSWHLNVK